MERIDELSAPPEPGKFYLVPCIYFTWFGRWKWWPVLGPRHEDKAHLNFEYVHYHVDGRFIAKRDAPAMFISYGGGDTDLEQVVSASPLNHREHELPKELTYRRKKCQRSYLPHCFEGSSGRAPFEKLFDAYANKQAVKGPNGWICPHKGLALGNQPVRPGGYIICPLHGLAIDAETGRCYPRAEYLARNKLENGQHVGLSGWAA